MQCEEWDEANSELFKESHDEAVHKNSYESRLYELISASLTFPAELSKPFIQKYKQKRGCEKMFEHFFTAPIYSQ